MSKLIDITQADVLQTQFDINANYQYARGFALNSLFYISTFHITNFSNVFLRYGTTGSAGSIITLPSGLINGAIAFAHNRLYFDGSESSGINKLVALNSQGTTRQPQFDIDLPADIGNISDLEFYDGKFYAFDTTNNSIWEIDDEVGGTTTMVVIPPAPSNISLTFSYAGFEQFYYPVISFTGSDNAEYYEVGVEVENESFQLTGNFDWVDIGLATEHTFQGAPITPQTFGRVYARAVNSAGASGTSQSIIDHPN